MIVSQLYFQYFLQQCSDGVARMDLMWNTYWAAERRHLWLKGATLVHHLFVNHFSFVCLFLFSYFVYSFAR
jgi:hypothetical protein